MTARGDSGDWRENASSRWVSVAARVAPAPRALEVAFDIGFAAAQAAAGDIETADHDRQHIVEVVRDAAGELADRFHLLALPQRFFGFQQLAGALHDLLFQRRVQIGECPGRGLLFLDIRIGADPAGDGVVVAAQRDGARDMPAINAVGAAQPEFGFVDLAGRKRG